MKISCLLFLFTSLAAAPLKVPQYRYGGSPNLRDHPGHYPFISYLTFRNDCKHIIDQTTEWFDPETVQQGDLIYLNLWYIDWFEKEVHDRIPHPYILVTGDVGAYFPDPAHKKLIYDPKLAAWFCRNMVFSNHPKLIQIPMGQDLALFVFDREAYDQLLTAALLKDSNDKKHLLHMAFYPRPHGDRDKIEKMFFGKPYCYTPSHSPLKQWIGAPRPQYYADMADSYFTLSPLGLETDCVRTWEAISMGCIPIVEHSFLNPLYEDLPVLLIHDWNEINPEFLERKYQELKGKKLDKAYFDYWRKLLKTTQTNVQNNDLSSSQWEATLWSDQDLEDLVSIVEGNLSLIYDGHLTTLRSFQLATALPYLRIGLHDPWLDRETYSRLSNHWSAPNLSFETPFDANAPYFLDLSHYRASIRMPTYHDLRHSLKEDLDDVYSELAVGTLLCGNKAEDTYVREVLESFSRENQITIEKKGSFWFCAKTESTASTLDQILPDPYPEIYEKYPLLPHDSQGWYSHHDRMKKLIQEHNVKNIVDVGPWMGRSTRHFATLIPDEGKVFAVDHWLGSGRVFEKEVYQQFLSNVVHEQLTDKIVPVRMKSRKAAKKLGQLGIPIDLIYIDAAQDYHSVHQYLTSWYPLIKEHGILCGDDWRVCNVQKAVLDFAEENNLLVFHEVDFWMLF